jgi:hypothetical protein
MSDAHILQLIGIIYVLIGVGMLYRRGYLQEVIEELSKSPALTWVFAILAMLMGFLMVTRDAAAGPWSILITVIGWIALVKGGTFLVLPAISQDLLKWTKRKAWIWSLAQWVILLGGHILLYVGFAVL